MTDETLTSIANLTNLKFLDISSSSVLNSTGVTDSGLQTVAAALSNLKWLDLSCTVVSDATIDMLCCSAPKLTHLSLQCCPEITDLCSESLSGVRLRTLDLTGSPQITTATFKHICNPR